MLMIKASATARSSLFRRPELLVDPRSQAVKVRAVSPLAVNLMNTSANMTVPELERLLHQETLQGLQDLSREATGRRRRRLEGELRRQWDWVPHWHLRADLTKQP
jgi:hypothetical protein